jgi:hypothetical protein
MLWKEEIPVSIELLLWARQCPCPYLRLAPFPCFFVPEDEGSCYHDLSLLARPGGLWTPNCWSGTLLHIEALRIPSASSPCLKTACCLGSSATETPMEPTDQRVFLELACGGAGSSYAHPTAARLWGLEESAFGDPWSHT